MEAEGLYRQVLTADPRHVEAMEMLGILALQAGRPDLAAPVLMDALAIAPRNAAALGNLGLAQQHLGQLKEAAGSLRQALAIKPDFSEVRFNLGNVLLAQGKPEEAAQAFRRALGGMPDLVPAHNNLGLAYRAMDRLAEARATFEKAIQLQPDFIESLTNLGNLLQTLGELDGAAEMFERVIAIAPNNIEAWYNLGNARLMQSRPEAAMEALAKALEIDPDFAAAHTNMGIVLQDLGRFDESVAAYERALAAAPEDPGLLNNLGSVLQNMGRLEEAVSQFSRAAALAPDMSEAHNNLAGALFDQGRLDEALESFARAVAVDAERASRGLIEPLAAERGSNRLLALNYKSGLTAKELDSEHRAWAARHAPEPRRPATHVNDRDQARPLRIGYVSGDFREHPVAYFLERVLAAHDPEKVLTYAYSNNAIVDDTTARLKGSVTQWRDIVGLPDNDVVERIRRDGIDILVDLSGHTAMNRMSVFAQRPAPVQASWLGYVGVAGMPAIDYLITDETTAPTGGEHRLSEALVRLPGGRFCYLPPEYAPEPGPSTRAERDHAVFASFNNIAKIGPDVIKLWAQVLAASPNSRLVLKWKSLEDAPTRQRLVDAFAAAGVDPDRLDIRGRSPHAEMLAEYAGIDVCLDTFPFNGGLTTCEALWMGVPVVTLPGETPASRQGAAIMKAIGLIHLTADSPEGYVERATAIANDPKRLADVRGILRPKMMASPLCDGVAFARILEAAYREMWRRRCEGEPAGDFAP